MSVNAIRLVLVVFVGLVSGCQRTGDAPSASTRAPASVVPKGSSDRVDSTCKALPADHDLLYKRGLELIDPYMQLTDRAPVGDAARSRKLADGIVCLDRALELAPSNWAAFWVRGKAYQALEDHARARESFASAYSLQEQNPDVGRELVVECLELGRSSEAVVVASRLSNASQTDAGLRANLALALLIDGQVARAQQEVSQARKLDATDTITKALEKRIGEVAAGVRPMPKTLGDLMR